MDSIFWTITFHNNFHKSLICIYLFQHPSIKSNSSIIAHTGFRRATKTRVSPKQAFSRTEQAKTEASGVSVLTSRKVLLVGKLKVNKENWNFPQPKEDSVGQRRENINSTDTKFC